MKIETPDEFETLLHRCEELGDNLFTIASHAYRALYEQYAEGKSHSNFIAQSDYEVYSKRIGQLEAEIKQLKMDLRVARGIRKR